MCLRNVREVAVVAAGFMLFANIEATLVPERTQCRSLVAEQRKLSGGDIQYLARTGRLALSRFKLKAKAGGTGR